MASAEATNAFSSGLLSWRARGGGGSTDHEWTTIESEGDRLRQKLAIGGNKRPVDSPAAAANSKTDWKTFMFYRVIPNYPRICASNVVLYVYSRGFQNE